MNTYEASNQSQEQIESQTQELSQEQSQNVADSQSKASQLSIKIKTLTGKEIGMSINSSDPVSYIKSQIEKSEGIPPEQQRLIFAGRQLLDNSIAEKSNIVGGSVIHLVLSLRGGNQH